MALIVEDGTGLATAESYASIAEADAYWDARNYPATWVNATTYEKEVALRKATQWIDAFYSGRWRGRVADDSQALSWPRVAVVDSEQRILDDDVVPERLKQATIEAALREAAVADQLMPDLDSGAAIASESVSAGGVSSSTTYAGGKLEGQKSFRIIHALVAPLTFAGKVYRS